MDAQMKMSRAVTQLVVRHPVLWIGVPVGEGRTRTDHPDHVYRRHIDLVVAVVRG